MAVQNRVRINAGEWRSRVLTFPDAPGLRPTLDRVRQTVFNWLGQDMHGLICLDLFAGTGAMGFEALSRGAKQVVMVEKSGVAYKSLIQNRTTLKTDAAIIHNMDALQFLVQNTQKFDVIFIDPPYNEGWIAKLIPQVRSHLAESGYLYVEAEFQIEESVDWQVVKHGRAGNVFYHLIESPSE